MSTHIPTEPTALQSLESALGDDRLNATVLPPVENAADSNRKKTGGELLFDRTVYTGIGFGVNEASSLVIADQLEHGIGKNLYARVQNWLVNSLKFGQKIAKSGKIITPHENAGNALLTFCLLLSGTALVWPMKALEDSKAYWVKKANHFLDKRSGTKLSEEQIAARDKEVETALACQPKQSWPSLLVGRLAGITSTMGNSMFIMGPERMNKLGNFSENLLTRGKFSTAALGAKGVPKTAAQRYAYLTGIETLCCAITSLVLEGGSKLFAKSNQKPRDPALCATAMPAAATGDSTNTDTQTRRIDAKHPELYKKKKIAPMENYTELASHASSGSLPAL